MLPIAIVQNATHDGPAFFGEWLNSQGLDYQVFAMYADDVLPQQLQAFSGLCVLGGPMSANDALPYFPQLLHLMQQAFAQGKPVIGHCLGGQLMARALGGTVQAAEHVEIGWSNLETTHSEAKEWFGPSASDNTLRLFEWHGESFSIPPGATQLLHGKLCANQAFVWQQRHLAMQFHCEVDVAKVRTWLELDEAEVQRCATSPGVQTVERLLQDLEPSIAHSQRIASHIYTRWAQGLAR